MTSANVYDLFFKQMKLINESSVPSKKFGKNSRRAKNQRSTQTHRYSDTVTRRVSEKKRRFETEQSKLVNWSTSAAAAAAAAVATTTAVTKTSGNSSGDRRSDSDVDISLGKNFEYSKPTTDASGAADADTISASNVVTDVGSGLLRRRRSTINENYNPWSDRHDNDDDNGAVFGVHKAIVNIDCENANDGFADLTHRTEIVDSAGAMSMTDRLLKRKRPTIIAPVQKIKAQDSGDGNLPSADAKESSILDDANDNGDIISNCNSNSVGINKAPVVESTAAVNDDDDDDAVDDGGVSCYGNATSHRKVQKRNGKDSSVAKARRDRASAEYSVSAATEMIGSACFNIQQTMRAFERVLKSPKRSKPDSDDSSNSSGDCGAVSSIDGVDVDQRIAEFERSEALLLSLLSEPDDMLDASALQWSKVCEIVNHFQYCKRLVTVMLRFFPNFSNLKHLLDRNRKLKMELRMFKNHNRPKSAMFVTCPQILFKATRKFSIAHFEKQFEDAPQ